MTNSQNCGCQSERVNPHQCHVIVHVDGTQGICGGRCRCECRYVLVACFTSFDKAPIKRSRDRLFGVHGFGLLAGPINPTKNLTNEQSQLRICRFENTVKQISNFSLLPSKEDSKFQVSWRDKCITMFVTTCEIHNTETILASSSIPKELIHHMIL